MFVRGLVTDGSTGTAITNAFVSLQRAGAGCCETYGTSTGADGRYALTVPPGITGKVAFQPPFADPIPHLSEDPRARCAAV